jgi:hypothetical protein
VVAFCSGYWLGHRMRYEQQMIDAELARHEEEWAAMRDADAWAHRMVRLRPVEPQPEPPAPDDAA